MLVLLDEDEKAEQEALMFGPPPLGPGAPPLDRLLAYGCARLEFVHTHHALLSDAGRDPQMRFIAPVMFHHRHIRVLLEAAEASGDLDAQAFALLSLLDADYVQFQLTERAQTLAQLGDAWDSVARKLCTT
jgi:hypothetical protein